MSGLESIGVTVESSGLATGNVHPILNEVRLALQKLLDTGEPTVIDLRGIPLGPGEEEAIEQALGEGEIKAELQALGPSVIRETALAGTWLVTHYNASNQIMAKFIEIGRVPAILKAQDPDISAAIAVIEEQLADQSVESSTG